MSRCELASSARPPVCASGRNRCMNRQRMGVWRECMEAGPLCQQKCCSTCNPSVSGGACWEEEWKRVLVEICGELVEDPFQVGHHIHLSFLKSVQHGHEDAAGAGSGI